MFGASSLLSLLISRARPPLCLTCLAVRAVFGVYETDFSSHGPCSAILCFRRFKYRQRGARLGWQSRRYNTSSLPKNFHLYLACHAQPLTLRSRHQPGSPDPSVRASRASPRLASCVVVLVFWGVNRRRLRRDVCCLLRFR